MGILIIPFETLKVVTNHRLQRGTIPVRQNYSPTAQSTKALTFAETPTLADQTNMSERHVIAHTLECVLEAEALLTPSDRWSTSHPASSVASRFLQTGHQSSASCTAL
ncbi:hypothetical protein CRM22_000304 [Opisthorchis felineus]|uniref:Uncharacterized protein n=1 Tax=Opisthorchis felineus TaxID=147828 RepID=A0A4S2MFZ0_OPIFE|nr:hypothetical protein CRM22_000304 [Opisthorchis felineus]